MTASFKDCMISVLSSLIEGKISREAASEWAVKIMNDDSIDDSKKEHSEILGWIISADAVAPDRPYLYEIDDFKEWLSSLLETERS